MDSHNSNTKKGRKGETQTQLPPQSHTCKNCSLCNLGDFALITERQELKTQVKEKDENLMFRNTFRDLVFDWPKCKEKKRKHLAATTTNMLTWLYTPCKEKKCKTLAKSFLFTTSWSNSVWNNFYTHCILSINRMEPLQIRHSSHEIATQPSQSVDRAGWQAKMASFEYFDTMT